MKKRVSKPSKAPLPPTSDGARGMVRAFVEFVVYLKSLHWTFGRLFEASDMERLTERTAPDFFGLVNELLAAAFRLECCKITDPAASGRKENFSVAHLVEAIDWPSTTRMRLLSLQQDLEPLRQLLLGARNKLLAHHDLGAVMNEQPLGHFPLGEDTHFLSAMEAMCNVMSESAFGEPIGSISVACQGDVLDPHRALSKSIAWDELLKSALPELRAQMTEHLHQLRRALP